jgi:hypothetical protein
MAEEDTKISADKIAENANSPSSVTVDGQTVSQHSIADQIAADKYLAKKAASTGKPANMGVRLGRYKAPSQY